MKSITKTIMVAVCCLSVLAGCTKRSITEPTNLAINLKAGVKASVSPSGKASIDEGNSFRATIAGWESSLPIIDYATAAKWTSTSDVTASTASSAIVLSPIQYYNENTAVKTYIKAWHPEATPVADGTATFDGVQDGTTDVLFASQTIGSAISAPMALAFNHPLTQLKFAVAGNDDFASLGVSLVSLSIDDAQLPQGLNFTSDEVIYSAAASLLVPTPAPVPITSTPAAAGAAVMMKPFATNTISVDVQTTAATYNNVAVTIDADPSFKPGKSYTITLNFAGTGVAVTSTVSKWEDGAGFGEIID